MANKWRSIKHIEGFEVQIGKSALFIHRHKHYKPDQWLMSWPPGRISAKLLTSTGPNEAKAEALGVVQDWLMSAIHDLPG